MRRALILGTATSQAFVRNFRPTNKLEPLQTPRYSLKMAYLLQFDGAADPNPGPASGSYVLFSPPCIEDGSLVRHVVQEGYRFIPHATNNEAEYTGLILGLEAAKQHKVENIEIEGDSNLVVNQVLGAWQVKTASLVPLKSKAANLYWNIPKRILRHIPRERNEDADRLSKEALKTRQEIHRRHE
jgi:ribonuclease HI